MIDTPDKKAIREAEKDIAWLEKQKEKAEQRVYDLHARGIGWKAKALAKSEPAYHLRIQELRDFIFYLKNEYQQKFDQGILDGQCFCGLFIKANEVCMECGKQACTLHSQALYEGKELLGRICDDCQVEHS